MISPHALDRGRTKTAPNGAGSAARQKGMVRQSRGSLITMDRPVYVAANHFFACDLTASYSAKSLQILRKWRRSVGGGAIARREGAHCRVAPRGFPNALVHWSCHPARGRSAEGLRDQARSRGPLSLRFRFCAYPRRRCTAHVLARWSTPGHATGPSLLAGVPIPRSLSTLSSRALRTSGRSSGSTFRANAAPGLPYGHQIILIENHPTRRRWPFRSLGHVSDEFISHE